MSIQEHLDKIRNAIYGREVRESIARGIETAYDDASEKGNANMEVKIARGTNPNLNTRLNKMDETDRQVTAQLAQTATSKVDKTGSGQVKWANIAQDAREQISGDKVAVVDDNSIITTNLTNNAVKTSKIGKEEVTPATTSFIKKSTNLLNRDNVIVNKAITNDGSIEENSDYVYSHKIDVLPGQTLFTRYVVALAFYTQDDTFIYRSYIQNMPKDFTVVPENCYYVRANITKSYYNFQDSQISISETEIPYEPFLEELDNIRVNANNITGQFDSSVLEDKSVTHQKTDFLEISANLLSRDNVTVDKTISNDGSIVDHPENVYSHRIGVLPGQTLFTRNVASLAFYTQDDNFIYRTYVQEAASGFTVVPENGYYVRANITRPIYDYSHRELQLSISETEVPYEPYSLTIKNFRYPEQSLTEFKEDDLFIIDGKLDETYQTAQLEGYENVEKDWLPEKIYQKFDELVTNYPSYVIKENLGRDSSDNFDVNLYRFKPEQVPTQNDTKRPKMFLVAGNHGYEKTHPYVLYLVMKKLCEEWQTDESLETLRWNVELLIIPCTNPSSFETNSRTNANGVDISRNFEANWDNSTDENKGAYPLSEPEAQYIDNVLQAHHEDTIFFTSLHNFSSSVDPDVNVGKPNEFIWVPAADKIQEHISQELVSKMTRLWKKKYEWLPQDDDLYFGYVDRATPPGLEGLQANLYGITASTYEISRIFRLEENPVNSSSQVITMGVEALVNLLLLNLKVGVDYYNRNKKVVKE